MDAEIIDMRDRRLWAKEDPMIATYSAPSLEEIAGNYMTTHSLPTEEYDLEHDKALLHNCLHDLAIVGDAVDLFVFKEKERLGLLSSAIWVLLDELSEDR